MPGWRSSRRDRSFILRCCFPQNIRDLWWLFLFGKRFWHYSIHHLLLQVRSFSLRLFGLGLRRDLLFFCIFTINRQNWICAFGTVTVLLNFYRCDWFKLRFTSCWRWNLLWRLLIKWRFSLLFLINYYKIFGGGVWNFLWNFRCLFFVFYLFFFRIIMFKIYFWLCWWFHWPNGGFLLLWTGFLWFLFDLFWANCRLFILFI